MKVGLLILLAISLLVSTLFVGVLANQIETRTQLTTKTQSIDITPARDADGVINTNYAFVLDTGVADWRNDQYSTCIPTTVVYKNETGTTMTLTTDYAFTAANASLTLKNVDNLNRSLTNITTVSYRYCPDGYVSGFGNSTMNMVPGFFVLMILGSCFVLIKVFEGMGRDD